MAKDKDMVAFFIQTVVDIKDISIRTEKMGTVL